MSVWQYRERKLADVRAIVRTMSAAVGVGPMSMSRSLPVSALLLVALAVVSATSPRPATAQSIYVDRQGPSGEQVLSLPYAFYNESFGAAAGYVYGAVATPQPQSAIIATAMVGTKGSAMVALLGKDIRVPGFDRLFVDPVFSFGYFGENDIYTDGNPRFPDERSGSNDSSENDFINGDGWDNFARLRFQYLLPIGDGRDEIVRTVEIDRGLLRDDAAPNLALTPWRSGRSYLQFRPFYRSQEIDGDDFFGELETNGIDVSFYWDNRDFIPSPERGQSLLLEFSRDFGWFNSSNSWTALQGEYDQYFSFGANSRFRQRVLAFDIWTAYSPTWRETSSGDIENGPPPYAGATLGGLWRLRGFPSERFSDKAAIYYAAELRLIPEWNPFTKMPTLQKQLGVQWLQFVPFVEIGRVAPKWDVEELHSDMKWSAGLGIRAWAKGIVVRVDTAASDEGVGVMMMVSQPFQF